MSTRTNVLIKARNGNVKSFYHHHDGYLEGVGFEVATMATMAEIMTTSKYNFEKGCREYDYINLYNGFINLMNKSTGYELFDFSATVAGDIEYLYLVEITEKGIKLSYLETSYGSNRQDYVTKILAGQGKELNLQINKAA